MKLALSLSLDQLWEHASAFSIPLCVYTLISVYALISIYALVSDGLTPTLSSGRSSSVSAGILVARLCTAAPGQCHRLPVQPSRADDVRVNYTSANFNSSVSIFRGSGFQSPLLKSPTSSNVSFEQKQPPPPPLQLINTS